MNLTVPLGLAIGITAIVMAAMEGIANPKIFLSPHAALIVIGGTLGAAMVCFPLSIFFGMIRVFLGSLTGAHWAHTLRTIKEIVAVAQSVHAGEPLAERVKNVRDPFLRESLELLDTGGLTDEELDDVLEKRLAIQNESYRQNSTTFKTIGKFPPAFGLVGTTLGMISLLQGIGEPNAFARIGPSMSIALVATFYGLIFANVILIPIGENLGKASELDLRRRRLVLDGVRLIQQKKHPILVAEYVKSYLLPAERNRLGKVEETVMSDAA